MTTTETADSHIAMTSSCALPVLLVIISRALEKGVTACSGGTRSILTFNSDLSPSSHGYEQRKSLVPRALAEHAHAGDFMCLQEVWLESDVREVIKYVESNFPYHYSGLHSAVSVLSKVSGQQRRRLFPGVASTPCNWKLIPFFICYVVKGCSTAGAKKSCMMSECKDFIFNMSRECRSCVALTSWSFHDILTICVNIVREDNRINKPGLFIASRVPLKSVEYVEFNPDKRVLTETGYIKARTQDEQLLICTHLSGQVDSTYSEVELPYRNYEEQQKNEILSLKSAFSNTPHILLGDFNTGPERTGQNALQGEMSANYALLQTMGHQNPYLRNKGSCTYCSDNPLVAMANNSRSGSKLIDHILTRDVSFDLISVQRVLDSGVPLSRHYGVQLDVCLN